MKSKPSKEGKGKKVEKRMVVVMDQQSQGVERLFTTNERKRSQLGR